MGLSLDRNLRIAGYRPTLFKNGLLSFLRTASPTSFISLSAFGSLRDGAIVFEECLDRGLIHRDSPYHITEAGRALIRAKATARTPLSKAQKVLDEFLARVHVFNNDPKQVSYVNRVWLFGSLMRAESTVGDIDIAIESNRRPEFSEGDKRDERIRALLLERDDVPLVQDYYWSPERWLMERALFGKRRHALLSGLQLGTDDLEALGVQCRLIYDRTRGGLVNDPVIARHPNSKGRADHVYPPIEMPDLTPAPLRPMDGRWLVAYDHERVRPEIVAFETGQDETYGQPVVADVRDLDRSISPFRGLDLSHLDGRERIALYQSAGYNEVLRDRVSTVIHREMKSENGQHILRVEFQPFLSHRPNRPVQLEGFNTVAFACSILIAADAERMLRRSLESATSTPVEIQIATSAPSHELTLLARLVFNILNKRNVRVEPGESTIQVATIRHIED